MTEQDQPARPVLRVVSGSPTPEELAVLTALAAAAGGSAAGPVSRLRRGGWNDPQGTWRRSPVPGPNAWASSLR